MKLKTGIAALLFLPLVGCASGEMEVGETTSSSAAPSSSSSTATSTSSSPSTTTSTTVTSKLFTTTAEPLPPQASAPIPPVQEPLPPAVATPPPAPTAVLGSYCEGYGSTGIAADGSTLYCAQLMYTDAMMWHTSPGEIPNPEAEAAFAESNAIWIQPGKPCYERDSTTTSVDGVPLYCSVLADPTDPWDYVWSLTP